MALNCGATFVKYLLCFFNFLLFALGGVLLAVSAWVAIDNTSFFLLTRITDNIHLQTYNESTVLETGAYILIAAGGLIFILGFLGCCGAAMESRPLLVLYGILVILVFLLQVTAGVLIAIYKREVETHLEDFLKVTLRKHYTHQSEPNSMSVTWDAMMTQMQCCGVNNFTDFELALRWQRENESDYIVPRACCMLQTEAHEVQEGVRAQGSGPQAYPLLDESCLYNPTENNSYHLIGCHGRLKAWAEANADCLLGVAGVMGAIEMIVVFLAFCLCAYSGEKTKCQCDPEDQQHLNPTLDDEGGEEDGKNTADPVKADEKNASKTSAINSNSEKIETSKEPLKNETAASNPTEPLINKDQPPAKEPLNKEEPKLHMKAEFDDFDDIDKVED